MVTRPCESHGQCDSCAIDGSSVLLWKIRGGPRFFRRQGRAPQRGGAQRSRGPRLCGKCRGRAAAAVRDSCWAQGARRSSWHPGHVQREHHCRKTHCYHGSLAHHHFGFWAQHQKFLTVSSQVDCVPQCDAPRPPKHIKRCPEILLVKANFVQNIICIRTKRVQVVRISRAHDHLTCVSLCLSFP